MRVRCVFRFYGPGWALTGGISLNGGDGSNLKISIQWIGIGVPFQVSVLEDRKINQYPLAHRNQISSHDRL